MLGLPRCKISRSSIVFREKIKLSKNRTKYSGRDCTHLQHGSKTIFYHTFSSKKNTKLKGITREMKTFTIIILASWVSKGLSNWKKKKKVLLLNWPKRMLLMTPENNSVVKIDKRKNVRLNYSKTNKKKW